MNYKRILFAVMLLFVVIAGASAVSSALFLDFLDEATAEPDTSVVLHGINLTIPAGYEEDSVNNSTDNMGITTEDYIYGNQEGYMIDIGILYNGNIAHYDVDDEEHSPATIAGKEGMASSGKNYYNFIYNAGDVKVSVLARNQSIVEKVIGG